MKIRGKAVSPGKLAFWAALLVAGIYMIVLPSIELVLDAFRVRPMSEKLEKMTPAQYFQLRTAKLAVFSIFAYAGACIGSFLNVAAASAPRGEPIALRDSACPQCGTPLRRIDNLPIYSYLKLRGRCRTCQAEIPIRYLFVELIGLVVFAALFLYELTTGAANVPGFREYLYAGIQWIILYPKWPVISVYFFHCFLFSALLMLALSERDRLRTPRWMTLSLPAVVLGLVLIYSPLLTVSAGDQTPLSWPWAWPGWSDRLATSIAGGALGWFLAVSARRTRLCRRRASTELPLAFALLGLAMGWQAVLTIAALWLPIMALLRFLGRHPRRPRFLTATMALFVVAFLHHPFWELLAELLSF